MFNQKAWHRLMWKEGMSIIDISAQIKKRHDDKIFISHPQKARYLIQSNIDKLFLTNPAIPEIYLQKQ